MNRVFVSVVAIGMVSFFLATASLLLSETRHASDSSSQPYRLMASNDSDVEERHSVSVSNAAAELTVTSPGDAVSATVEGLASTENNLTLRSETGDIITVQVPAVFLYQLQLGEVVKVNMQGQRVIMIYTQRHEAQPELPYGL